MRKRLLAIIDIILVLVSVFGLMSSTQAQAPKEVVIGCLFSLTGPGAFYGVQSKYTVEAALDLINNKYDSDIPLARTEGLPNLGGAKLRAIIIDHQGSPEKGLAAAEKLINDDKVVAIAGANYSSVAAVASQVCERYGVPYLAIEVTSPSLHRRGFKWFFRTTPHDEDFSHVMFKFMDDLKKKTGIKLETLGILYEDSIYGTDSSNAQRKFAAEFGYKVVADIKYRAKSTSMISEIQKLQLAKPDVLLPTSYTSDAILITKTMKELNYMPKILLGQNSGHSDPELAREMGKDIEGFASRNVFAMDLAEKRPIVKLANELYKKRSNRDLTDIQARSFMGIIVLADAINRAKSSNPEAIRKALQETDLKPEQLIMPWKGIRFGPDGQNTLGTPIITQWYKGEMVTVWPFDLAKIDFIYPLPPWLGR